MKIYNLASKRMLKYLKINDSNIIICVGKEILDLRERYKLDEESIMHCLDNEDSVRFNNYDSYDFLSLVSIAYENREVNMSEVSMYLGSKFLIIVVPEESSNVSTKIDEYISKNKLDNINLVFYYIINLIIDEIIEGLNRLEDDIKNLENDMINQSISSHSFIATNAYKDITYKNAKLIRELTYIVDTLIANNNHMILEPYMKYFLNLKNRIDKTYNFSTYLGKLGDNLLNIYDSRLTQKTNEVVTRLTVVTIFFGPMTIITGIYGMNFKYMPELNFKYGYPLSIFLMILTSVIIYILLKKRKIV